MAHSLGTVAPARRPLSAGLADFALPAAILMAVAVVLAPVPQPLVDLLLAANLTVSVLALLGALAARTPLEMSGFPTFLLGATLIRLVLNIATTRLILSRAAIDGPAAAGRVVEAFGEFVAANDLVVGAVIFAIIAIVQFVVITAGATRTSEVAARFTLDGLPGRQMAIDAEVQAGGLTRDQARQARLDLQRQADFFAAMDGSSRFVRGEAVASVVITLVNVAGGLAIGIAEHGMALDRALGLYSRLTIGDGLASAVPSLLVSVATGLLLSRSTQAVDLSREFGRQFTARPHVLAITGVFLSLLSLTDLPFLPLAGMAGVLLTGALVTARAGRRPAGPADPADSVAADVAPTRALFGEDRVVVELGRGLVRLVAAGEGRLLDSVAALRARVAGDLGFVLPEVTLRDDLALPDRGYRVSVAGQLVAEEELPPGRLLVIPPPGAAGTVAGSDAVDWIDGRRCTWAGHAQAETARRRGATVLDEAGCIARALEGAVRRHADRLLSREDASRLVESLRESQPSLVAQVTPEPLSIARIQRTLQCLLAEGVPIRPLGELLEIMADHAAEAPEPADLAEIVRRRLAAAICRRARDPQGRLTAVRLAGAALEACGATGTRPAAKVVAEVRRAIRIAVERGGAPVVLVPAAVRRQVRAALARELPTAQVLAEEEAAEDRGLEVFATVSGAEPARAA
ncbi:MAG: FHIPEP family type III secretion protein [Planctomycetaceae bacterium]